MLLQKPDTILKMSFHATNHTVHMHNHVWISTRAMEIHGFKYDSHEAIGEWMNTVYKEYYALRAAYVRNTEDVSQNDMMALMQGYCSHLKQHEIVQKYWVVLSCEQKQLKLDSGLITK